jgi:hypothetical protein
MHIIDLSKNSHAHADRLIRDYCGGKSIENKWTHLFNKGVGGLRYIDPASQNNEQSYKANISFYKNGIGVYFRNFRSNKLILFSTKEINKLELIHGVETIRPLRYSPFSLLNAMGYSYKSSSRWLLPKEIINERQIKFYIITDDHYFEFDYVKFSYDGFIDELRKAGFGEILKIQVFPPNVVLE